MARTERPLEIGDHRLLGFAADLRELRKQAGNPGYRELSRRAHYSSSALADAASGRRLPSLALTLAYVMACGGDQAVWEQRWRVLAAELAAITDTEPADGAAPYAGLAAFQVEDADRFHGREKLVAELADRVSRQRFVVVVGPSGSGKSSLLRAGLVYRARRDSLAGVTMVMTPGPHPLEECAAQLGAVTDATPSALHEALRTDPRCLHLTALGALVDRPADSEVLLVVDQFEEVFTLCQDEDERARFVSVLHTAARAPNSRTRIVLGLRADFYAHCAHNPELVAALGDAQVLVGPMGPEELRAVITQPAVDIGCRVENALVSQVIAEAVGQPGVLPLVSHALLETWRRRRGNTLTLAGYEAAGGITQSIARTVEAVYAGLSEDQQRWARQLFLRLVALGEGTEDTKRRLDRGELDVDDPDRAEVLERLARARLVTLGQNSVELTHEAFVRCWPRLHRWLTDNREGLRIHRQLTEAANTWQSLGGDPGALYRGHRLTQAEQWATSGGDAAISTRERQFLRASLSAQAHDQAVTRRRTRRLRQLLALVTVLLLVAVVATGYALRAERSATEQRNLAVAQKVLSQAAALRNANPALSIQLSLAAYRLAPIPEARKALLNVFGTPYATVLAGHTDSVVALGFSADGQTLATASADKTVRLWDTATPHRPRELATLTGPAGMIHATLSPDGRTLATASVNKTVRLWDVTDRGQPRQLADLAGDAAPSYVPTSLAFSPDGRTLATAGLTDDHHGIVLLWDVASRAQPHAQATLTGQFGGTYAVAFMPSGHTLAAVSAAKPVLPATGSEVRLWDVTDRTQPREQAALTGFAGRTVAAFHPDGRTLVTAQDEDRVTLWDVSDVRQPRSQAVLSGLANSVTAIALSPDGYTLAAASADRSVRLWDISDPLNARTLTTLTGANAAMIALAFSPDGSVLASAGTDNRVRLTDVAEYGYSARAHGAVYAVAFSADGRMLATGNTDGTTGLWDATDPYRMRALATLTPEVLNGPVDRVVFSPRGRFVATDDLDHGLKLWDIDHPRAPASVVTNEVNPLNDIAAMEFSPDGRILAGAGADGILTLWDVTDIHRPERLASLTGFHGAVHSLTFSPDGHLVAARIGRSFTALWDVSDPRGPRLVADVATPGSSTSITVAASPDGHTMAIGGSDHQVRLWDISNPRDPRALATITAPNSMSEVEFGPDGHTLAIGLLDGSTELWDVADPNHPRDPVTLAGPATGGRSISSIAFSPTTKVLATAGAHQFTSGLSTRLWDTDLERVAARVCGLAWPTITPTEWSQYFPGITYRPPCPSGG